MELTKVDPELLSLLKPHLLKIFPIFINNQFRGQERSMLLADLVITRKDDGSSRIAGYEERLREGSGSAWDEALQAASAECWAIFIADADKRHLANALEEFQAGFLDLEGLATRIANYIVMDLLGDVKDRQRDRDYAGIRETISEVKKASGENVFFTDEHKKYKTIKRKGKGMGMMYSPIELAKDYKEFLLDDLEWEVSESMKEYSAVETALRKSIKDPDGGYKWAWNRKAVAKEAIHFWKAFVNHINKGEPTFIPVYAFYYWLKKSHDLCSNPITRSVENAESDKPSLLDNPGESIKSPCEKPSESCPSIEQSVFENELASLAKDFVATLPPDESKFCYNCYILKKKASDYARELGLPDDKPLVKSKTSFVYHCQAFITRYPELNEDREAAINFLNEVQNECEKLHCPR